jgi:hypothetical protein
VSALEDFRAHRCGPLCITDPDVLEELRLAVAAIQELEARALLAEWCVDYLIGEVRGLDLYYAVPEAKIGDAGDVKRCLALRYTAEVEK